MTKYRIIGTDFDYSYQCYSNSNNANDPNQEVIATFDTQKMAEDYIENSKLKQPKRHKIFKSSSLLQGCEYAEVQKYYEEPDPPHNPTL